MGSAPFFTAPFYMFWKGEMGSAPFFTAPFYMFWKDK